MAVWKSRIQQGLTPEIRDYLSSLQCDAVLVSHDIMGSIAHARMLDKCGIVPGKVASNIEAGLKKVLAKLESGNIQMDPELEDVHMNVEALLEKEIGEDALHLHAGRSRNDQVALDLRLYLREAIVGLVHSIHDLQSVLVSKAEDSRDMIVPGYTHMQRAQPVLLGHIFMAHFYKLQRDSERLLDTYKRVNVSPLGAGALAGTSLPIDPGFTAKLLGFEKVFDNSMDAVSGRDFAAEMVFDLSMIMVHLSSMCEEMVLWSSKEFGWVTLGPGTCTGSSLMPQKKNPDVFEIGRAKTGKVIGNLVSLVTMLKGLPLAYNRDLQQDKPAVFDAIETTYQTLVAISGALDAAEFHPPGIESNDMLATDMAECLVKKGIPFRTAYGMVGSLVARAEQSGSPVDEKDLEALNLESGFGLVESVAGRDSHGGTSNDQLENSIAKAKDLMKDTGQLKSMEDACSKAQSLLGPGHDFRQTI
jgi:argininosuccinate lyase